MAKEIPAVDYLVLGDPPRLRAHECVNCGALYFDRRNACSRCTRSEFGSRDLASTGTVRAFTIVHRAGKNVEVPYTSVVVDLDEGGVVKATLRDATDPDRITAGLRVRLVTFPVDTDDDGAVAVAFGFVPMDGQEGPA